RYARSGTLSRSGSSYWPRSAVYAYGIAPWCRIQATATEVSRPPENAIPTRSPTGSEVTTLDMAPTLSSVADLAEPGVIRWTAARAEPHRSPCVNRRRTDGSPALRTLHLVR